MANVGLPAFSISMQANLISTESIFLTIRKPLLLESSKLETGVVFLCLNLMGR